ncbi:BLUF domain-containing protein [Plastoroseomonas arctica]|uniref:BLUF domain-containing protein n=1 Tax=Plastoroseomonas arctica TaxID=1509237 RepID=A0AAF1JYV0_9PROT|nr:BLUF domain-containing protein [Plastoroseomonas arctica]MBR0656245.1 BLUF domain-containing protein [Plastoroseomonas arctica]
MAHPAGIEASTEERPGISAMPLATVVYRSRSVAPLPGPELQHLIQTAQSRNHAESITGVMLYDKTHFFQWLEGPPEGIERVMHSIHNDPRHTDLEILARRSAVARKFIGWDMKLAAPDANALDWRDDVIEPPADIIESLQRQPDAAPSLLVKLIPLPVVAAQTDEQAHAPMLRAALGQAPAAVLKTVILSSVIPMLLQRVGVGAADDERSPVNPRAAELAELLLASDEGAALDLIRELRGNHGDPRRLYAPVFEPAARRLGDLWNDDICTEVEITLALCRLQTAVRLLGADAPPAVLQRGRPNVLVAPVPGELHHLVAALDSEWLWSAGWAPQTEYPANDRALQELLSASWIDVLDLSLSAAFRRPDSLPQLSRSIAQARRASRNPALLVVVGGRAFVEDQTAGAHVGADQASATAAELDQRIMQGMSIEAALHRAARRQADAPETAPKGPTSLAGARKRMALA